jgi:hypothetical protein
MGEVHGLTASWALCFPIKALGVLCKVRALLCCRGSGLRCPVGLPRSGAATATMGA